MTGFASLSLKVVDFSGVKDTTSGKGETTCEFAGIGGILRNTRQIRTIRVNEYLLNIKIPPRDDDFLIFVYKLKSIDKYTARQSATKLFYTTDMIIGIQTHNPTDFFSGENTYCGTPLASCHN
jgi:hypothetical protein